MYKKLLLVDDDAKNKLCKLHNGIPQWPESRVNTKSFPRRCGDESIVAAPRVVEFHLFPAGAGMNLGNKAKMSKTQAFPRRCGDESN